MKVRLDPASKTPPSEQVRAQVVLAIARGRLLPGDRLPSVRQLAEQLGLAPNTVAKAYRGLESAALVEGRGRLGTFVRERLPRRAAGAEARLTQAARAYAERAAALGFDAETAVEAAVAAAERTFGSSNLK